MKMLSWLVRTAVSMGILAAFGAVIWSGWSKLGPMGRQASGETAPVADRLWEIQRRQSELAAEVRQLDADRKEDQGLSRTVLGTAAVVGDAQSEKARGVVLAYIEFQLAKHGLRSERIESELRQLQVEELHHLVGRLSELDKLPPEHARETIRRLVNSMKPAPSSAIIVGK